METGSVRDVPSEVSAQILEWPETILIENSDKNIPWGRPNLWDEVVYPKKLVGLAPIERYVCYLYYTCGLTNSQIGLRLGYDKRAVDRIHTKINNLAWSQATPIMKRLMFLPSV